MVRAVTLTKSQTTQQTSNGTVPPFMFATGIENSCPTVEWQGKNVRRDGMELSGHYKRWREDFDLVKELGIDFLRYGPPYYKVHHAPGRYNWDFTDETFNALRELQIHPITDLCHFGVPDWFSGFDDSEWPEQFAHYARAFATRFPWVRLYTPVNEMLTAALFSGLRGKWNERKSSDRGFVTSMVNMAKATILAEQEILKVQPQAIFIQSEASSYYHRSSPQSEKKAAFDNQRRFLPLDLIYGHDVSAVIRDYMRHNGVTDETYSWLMEHGQRMRPHCILGNDYYSTNEHMVVDGDDSKPSGEILGYYVVTHQYYNRYLLPMMHTETNHRQTQLKDEDWLTKQWLNVLRLKDDGVPMMGFTWYSLIDQTDWDTALVEINYNTINVGLYDKDRHPHSVANLYKKTIETWRDQLAYDSLCRNVHFFNTE